MANPLPYEDHPSAVTIDDRDGVLRITVPVTPAARRAVRRATAWRTAGVSLPLACVAMASTPSVLGLTGGGPTRGLVWATLVALASAAAGSVLMAVVVGRAAAWWLRPVVLQLDDRVLTVGRRGRKAVTTYDRRRIRQVAAKPAFPLPCGAAALWVTCEFSDARVTAGTTVDLERVASSVRTRLGLPAPSALHLEALQRDGP